MKLTIVQQEIFERLRMSVPDHLSLANLIADTLKISRDAAYRRIRGDTRLSLKELEMLSAHFDIAIDVNVSFPENVFRHRKGSLQHK